MLVIRSVAGEKIRIGEDIILTICEIGREKVVKIGIEAPREVTVLRQELVNLLREEAASAAKHKNVLGLMEMLNEEG